MQRKPRPARGADPADADRPDGSPKPCGRSTARPAAGPGSTTTPGPRREVFTRCCRGGTTGDTGPQLSDDRRHHAGPALPGPPRPRRPDAPPGPPARRRFPLSSPPRPASPEATGQEKPTLAHALHPHRPAQDRLELDPEVPRRQPGGARRRRPRARPLHDARLRQERAAAPGDRREGTGRGHGRARREPRREPRHHLRAPLLDPRRPGRGRGDPRRRPAALPAGDRRLPAAAGLLAREPLRPAGEDPVGRPDRGLYRVGAPELCRRLRLRRLRHAARAGVRAREPAGAAVPGRGPERRCRQLPRRPRPPPRPRRGRGPQPGRTSRRTGARSCSCRRCRSPTRRSRISPAS